ncbi:protoglobin domain-containing protein [Bacillus massiliigorillae]|uniref:protoglobin domain-containing protein n=1 Tax=Bacillus massiliigorillae TaxID=1243664 RepID=UPI0003A8C73C|nr:protoglobin domain-containing protein [Bacillus massiliigorillae]
MLLTEEKIIDEIDTFNESGVHISVGDNIDLQKQIQMIDLRYEDLQIVHCIRDTVVQHIDDLVNEFYKIIAVESSLIEIIQNHSSIDRLKRTLRQHIIELFDGHIDEQFINKRKIIAEVHVQIGLKPKWYMSAFQSIFLSLIQIMNESIKDKGLCVRSIESISKLVNLEQQIVLDAYERVAAKIKMQDDVIVKM